MPGTDFKVSRMRRTHVRMQMSVLRTLGADASARDSEGNTIMHCIVTDEYIDQQFQVSAASEDLLQELFTEAGVLELLQTSNNAGEP